MLTMMKFVNCVDDFCDGARYNRIQQALPEGTCALTSVYEDNLIIDVNTHTIQIKDL